LTVLAVNGLPWERTDLVTLTLPETVSRVAHVLDSDGDRVPFEQHGAELRFCAVLPPVGTSPYILETEPVHAAAGDEMTVEPVSGAVIQNEFLLLEADSTVGIRRLVWKPTGAILIENTGDFLVAQRDDGSFQIESPNGAEVAAAAGTIQVFPPQSSPFGQTLRLTGAFPALAWAGPNNTLTREMVFRLVTGKPRVDVTLRLEWKGEGSRVRLKLPTKIDSSEGIYEIPFGTVTRKPYGIRGNARGEWPTHRFVAIEDERHGIALANTGVGGVEVSGGTLWTTLLRAPKSTEVGMLPDDTSSQHGTHVFPFALIPYAGTWSAAGVSALAQEVNHPVHTVLRPGKPAAMIPASYVSIDRGNVVLSAIKTAEDGSGDLIVRVYETVGQAGSFTLTVRDAKAAYHSDLREQEQDAIQVNEGRLIVPITPYEIKTVRLKRHR
jgi:alpha-mannosidase